MTWKKLKVDMDLQKKFDDKAKLCEKIKIKHNDFKKRMDDLNEFLQGEKQNFSQTQKEKFTLGANEFTVYRRRGTKFIKSTCVKDTNIVCNYCCQFGHMKNDFYVRKNVWRDMRSVWMVRSSTNSHGLKNEKIPHIIS